MPELRKDPIVGRWVIIADERAKRPHDFKSEAPPPADPATCPFCEGHEDNTPPEIIAYRNYGSRPNGPGWRIRVVPNRFPGPQGRRQPQQARRRHLRHDGRRRCARGDHREPEPSHHAWPRSAPRASAKSSGSTAIGSST